MSFKAIFKTTGQEFRVLSSSYNVYRAVDEMGRPTSSTVGGEISISMESNANNLFFEHISIGEMLKDGTITYIKRNEEATMRELSFKNAFISSFSETFDHSGGSGAMITSITLVAQVIIMGNGEIINEWKS
ncbi:type VI secretion system tube protein TssD [uncultured Draconibacterium sp.]|uniref:type VI secretion system tube protein TssD n=1 Tax=uncultured Draconibacterium sp. TaxID=1573823 RepID=UPI0025E6048B|nr:type VI secretion system tube protein TssD [uncultured Draconibacterium sp.]